MTIYYIEQDNTVWCCEEDSGTYYENIGISFVKCECSQLIEQETFEEHLQSHKGGGRVLKWRNATENEISAWYASGDEFFEEGIKFERERIIKILTDQLTQKVSVWDESLGHAVSVNQADLIIALIKEGK